MTRISQLLLATALVVAGSSGATASTVSGTVFCGNAPMPGATFEAITDATQQSAGSAETTAAGGYSLALVNAVYDLVVTPPTGSGCSGQTIQNHPVSGDETYDIILFLPDPGHETVNVSGLIRGPGGLPWPGIEVGVHNDDHQAWATTDASGRYAVAVPVGSYLVELNVWSAPFDFAPNWVNCHRYGIAVAGDTVVDVTVPPFVAISGTVRSQPSDALVAGVQVYVSGGATFDGFACAANDLANTDPDGRYGPLYALGDATVSVASEGEAGRLEPAETSVTTPAAGELTVDLRPVEIAGVSVSGTVTGLGGVGVAGMELRWSSDAEDFWVMTDAAGHYALQVRPASYRVELWATFWDGSLLMPDSVECRNRTVTVADALVYDVNFDVVAVSGAVVSSPSGAPLAGAMVHASMSAPVGGTACSANSRTTSAADGRYGPLLVLGGGAATFYAYPASGYYETGTVSLTLPASGTFELDLEPQEYATSLVSGVLTDSAGAPIAGVNVRWEGGLGTYSASTTVDGRYSLQARDDTYRVRLDGAWYDAPERPESLDCTANGIVVVAGDTVLDMTVPLVTVAGQVTNATAIPVPGVTLHASGGAAADGLSCSAYDRMVSAADGRYTLHLLRGGTSFYFYPPSGSGYLSANISTTLTGDLHQQVVLQLPDHTAPSLTAGPFAIHHSTTSVSIQWTTNEATNAALEYEAGTSLTGGGATVTDAAYVTDHIVTLTGLAAATVHAFQVTSRDSAGNPVTSPVLSFTTAVDPDTTAPAITAGPVVAYLAPTQILVTWTTDEPADSHVAFGLAGAALDGAVDDGGYGLTHALLLTGLAPETAYTLIVSSSDPDQNGPTAAAPLVVTTPAEADTQPPVISELRTACVTDVTMAVCWETDETASSNATFTAPSGAVTSLSSSGLATARCMTLSGLSPATAYALRVSSSDGGGNSASAGPLLQTTAASAAEVAPVLSGLEAITTGPTSAVVRWQTDVAASSFVAYGTDPDHLDGAAGDLSATTTEHEVVLTGLTPGVTTYVVARSTDPCQQRGESATAPVVDIDECATGAAGCDANATCTNSAGAFACACDAGYSGDGFSCVDIDECATGAAGCDANSTCTNSAGAFTCACDAGYSGDGFSCVDIDECATGAAGCDATAACTNSAGAFTCVCDAGYSGDGVNCVDIDECATGAAGCDANASCTNSAGAFTCACVAGYSGDGVSCVDIDECSTGAAGCDANATCTNSAGSFTCACDAGYSGDGFSCADIDECATGAAGCDANATCTNSAGAFTCVCDAGYSGDGVSCVDIDECATGAAGCDANATCTNSAGAFTCVCDAGYSGDGFSCVDIDECATGAAGCDANANCTNSVGAFTCACNAGFSGDGINCVDVDECATGAAGCDANTSCTNSAGAFTCACNAGFSGDGVSCVDIDECATGAAGCDANASCTNSAGAFTCACVAGYSGDGVSCVDIDECATGTAGCGEHTTCTNTPGGFTCPCAAGYEAVDGACVFDTCPGLANPDQADLDLDGLGDACDADDDGDGLDDAVEDVNGDGIVDAAETDPRAPDSDEDGLPDGVEDANHDGVFDADETDPRAPDTDGDTLADGSEDANHDGVVDPTETDPRVADSDGDTVDDAADPFPRDPYLCGDGDGDGCDDCGSGSYAPTAACDDGDPCTTDTCGAADGCQHARIDDGSVAGCACADADADGVCDLDDVCPGADDTVDRDGDGVPACQDCDDDAPGVHPGGVEVCDGVDNDCDGVLDAPACAEVGLALNGGGGCAGGPAAPGGVLLVLATAAAALVRRRRRARS